MDSDLNSTDKSQFLGIRRISIWFLGIVNILFVSWCLHTVFLDDNRNTEIEEWYLKNLGWILQMVIGALFSTLAIVIVSKSKPARGVVSLSGYLTAQGLATGFLMGLNLVNNSMELFLLFRGIINTSAYALSLRFTQQFPTILTDSSINQSLRFRPMRYILKALNGTFKVWIFSVAIIVLSYLIPFDYSFQIGQLIVIFIVVFNLVINYRVNNKFGRKKIYWLLLGALCLLLGRIIIISSTALYDFMGMSNIMIVGIVRSSVWALANAGLITCLLLAIFYHGALDSRLVFRRTVAVSTGIGLLLFMFATLENFVSNIIVETLGVKRNLIQSIFGGILALIFKPLHRQLNNFFDKILPSIEPKP